MDDLATFERRVASEVIHGMGPSLPVDDAAILAAITAAQPRKWRIQTMVGALRTIAAAAIVADLLGVATEAANVKATRGEGLGPIGRGEGIAAQAIVLLERVG